jgi:hypothetical protein
VPYEHQGLSRCAILPKAQMSYHCELPVAPDGADGFSYHFHRLLHKTPRTPNLPKHNNIDLHNFEGRVQLQVMTLAHS